MSNHICVVMAVHNRFVSVDNALCSWAMQTWKDFSLVLADDGSSDDIHALIRLYEGQLNLQYYRQHYAQSGNVAVVLNKGTKLVPEETTHVWYTDGDIIFNPRAVEAAYGHLKEYPDTVITGRYDWLPAMDIVPSDVEMNFQAIVDCALLDFDMPTDQGGARIDGVKRRVDHRIVRMGEQWFDHQLLDSCKPLLGANVIVPYQAWHEMEGWDEHIPGCNANDADFGWCLTDLGYNLLTCDCIVGYHQYHQRDPKKLQEGVRKALPYIFSKHRVPIPERWRRDET